jgi:predicted amidohydrolase YtcJ
MEEAMTAFTRGAAYAELADREKGHLSVGALADLTVTSVDPFTASADQIRGARSVLTIIGGRVVHDVP